MNTFFPALLSLLLMVPAPAATRVYRWIDEAGDIHFGDRPPAQQEWEEVPVAPAPPADPARGAERRVESPRGHRPAESGLGEGERGAQAPEFDDGPIAGDRGAPECFSPLGAAWGGRIPDSREGVSRLPLTDPERRRVITLFGRLEGRSAGIVEEIICIRPDARPPIRSYTYDVHTRVRRESNGLFRLEARLEGLDNRSLQRRYFNFLVSPDGIRFRVTTEDYVAAGIDQPGNDVETLEVATDRLLFFWRRGGNVRRTLALDLNGTERGFRMEEYLFVQGVLAEKRSWYID